MADQDLVRVGLHSAPWLQSIHLELFILRCIQVLFTIPGNRLGEQ